MKKFGKNSRVLKAKMPGSSKEPREAGMEGKPKTDTIGNLPSDQLRFNNPQPEANRLKNKLAPRTRNLAKMGQMILIFLEISIILTSINVNPVQNPRITVKSTRFSVLRIRKEMVLTWTKMSIISPPMMI
jgi:hypothetical protein